MHQSPVESEQYHLPTKYIQDITCSANQDTNNNKLQTTDTGPFTPSAMTDLQGIQFGGSTEKTLWQLCQLVVAKITGQLRFN